MEVYAKVLLWVVPLFIILIIIEIAYGHFTGKQTHTFMDTLSSLSSGMTNILKDILGLVVVIVSYPFYLKNYPLYPSITAYHCTSPRLYVSILQVTGVID